MAIWYKDGKEKNLKPISLGREDMGLDVYLCASGPSLANVRDSDLHVNGSLVAAVNNAYPHIKPDIWFGLDDYHCFHSTLWTQPFMKFVRGVYHDRDYHGIDIGKQHNTYYADIKNYPGENKPYKKLWDDLVLYEDYTEEHEKIFYNREPSHSFLCKDTCRFATSILLYLGAKKFFLTGMDLSTEHGNYYSSKLPVKSGTEYLNHGTYKQVREFYKWASEVGGKYGVEFISCTENSSLNEFLEYVPLEDALKSTVKSRAYPRYNIVDGRTRNEQVIEERKAMTVKNYNNKEDEFFNNDGELLEEEPIIVEGLELGTPWSNPNLTLVDKMILFECDNVVVDRPNLWKDFWQELVDKGIPWDENIPRHYARTAAALIREGLIFLKSTAPLPPEGWDEKTFLQGPLLLGYDVWDRPPTSPNWSRPFRWKQIQKSRVKIFKDNMKKVEGGAKLNSRKCGGCKG